MNMTRGLKNRTPISNAVETELYEQLKQLSQDTMIPMSKLLDRGIELVLKEYEKQPAK
ncbi:MAG TPA: ribbon-helix-helix domain-containing protein [Epulopiscium sp.]|nr:ribbon-helix-helix domain-containing protein [Candidatus Epulonipiscium sp.]